MHVSSFLQQIALHLRDHDAQVMGEIAAGSLSLALLLRRVFGPGRPPAEELERRRREHLANTGRTTIGVIVESHTLSGQENTAAPPEILVYSYRIAGVTYQCVQDVSRLRDRIPLLHADQSIVDQPVQVRYDPSSPGNSILLSETWNGLWRRME
jgi:hypothetical protein